MLVAWRIGGLIALLYAGVATVFLVWLEVICGYLTLIFVAWWGCCLVGGCGVFAYF